MTINIKVPDLTLAVEVKFNVQEVGSGLLVQANVVEWNTGRMTVFDLDTGCPMIKVEPRLVPDLAAKLIEHKIPFTYL